MEFSTLLENVLDNISPPTSTLNKKLILSEEEREIIYARAFDFYRNGKYSEAIALFKSLTVAKADERRNWVGLAASLQMQMNYSEAIDAYSIAVLINPNEPFAHWHAAQCLHSLKHYKRALEALESAYTLIKDNKSLHSFLPQIELLRGSWSETLNSNKGNSLCQA